eukprot:scaffold4961_cov114-Isochrysis_galbana.AAC.1
MGGVGSCGHGLDSRHGFAPADTGLPVCCLRGAGLGLWPADQRRHRRQTGLDRSSGSSPIWTVFCSRSVFAQVQSSLDPLQRTVIGSMPGAALSHRERACR